MSANKKISPVLSISILKTGLKLVSVKTSALKRKVLVRLPFFFIKWAGFGEPYLRRRIIVGMAAQVILPDLFWTTPAREQPCGIQWHIEDAAGGLVGFGADILRRLNILTAQIEHIVTAA